MADASAQHPLLASARLPAKGKIVTAAEAVRLIRDGDTIATDGFADPRFGGGRLNARTTVELVRLLPLDGQEYLFYPARPINVGIIRATTADSDGNLSMEREALTLEVLAIAMAAHNSGGLVIAQVERIADRGALNPRQVKMGEALAARGLAPYIYESAAEARAHLLPLES
ncbi:CoA-transferase [uncultured Thiodictyon sp.]|jgi:acyl CoA:acetate/3-ketoacid CoA transferase|uniref:CoA-transferase n=1 Tax=uncultured Thiodictyon sp. TaxID=1846217 RepID=UPI0025F990ED|nr:CoA-transferase [uncultured Thiodictyon sp.]